MNFYKHHIGDYAAATAHLSFVEDAAYSRLLRIYYRDEKPLPADLKAVQRLAGARTRDEKRAIEAVLGEFFHRAGDGWRNKRADEEIAAATAQADTNRRIAEAREARRRALNEPRIVHESCNDSLNDSLPVREPSQTPDSRLQTPDTRLQTPDTRQQELSGRHDDCCEASRDQIPQASDTHRARDDQPQESASGTPRPTAAGTACRVMREAGLTHTNPTHPGLLALLDAGATEAQLADAAAEANRRGKGFAYALGILRGQLADAVAPPRPAQRRDPEAIHARNLAVASDWLAAGGGA